MDMPLYPGDPLTPGVGATRRREAARAQGRADAHEDSGAADLLRRRAAAAGVADGAGRARRLARRRCRSRTNSAPGPRACGSSWRSTGISKPLYNVIARISGERHFPDQWVMRGNHHDAWVNGAEDPVSGMAADAGGGARARRAAQAGMAPKRTIIYARGTAKSRGCSAPPSGPRRTPPSCGRKRSSTSTPTPTAEAFSARVARTRSSSSSTTSRETSSIPKPGLTVWKRQQARADRRRGSPRSKAKVRAPGGPAHRRARLRVRLHAVPPAPRHPDAEHRLRRRGRRAASITRFTTTSTSTRISSTPTSSTAARWHRPAARR